LKKLECLLACVSASCGGLESTSKSGCEVAIFAVLGGSGALTAIYVAQQLGVGGQKNCGARTNLHRYVKLNQG